MTTERETHLSRALAAAVEVIDAQAAYINQRNTGRWSQTVKDEMERKQEQFEEYTGHPTGNSTPLQGKIPEEGMFDKGGYLPSGLTQVTNTTGETESADGLYNFEPRRCHGVRPNDGYRCILPSDHLWPHQFSTDSDTDRCPAINGKDGPRCTRTTGHIGAHEYGTAEG